MKSKPLVFALLLCALSSGLLAFTVSGTVTYEKVTLEGTTFEPMAGINLYVNSTKVGESDASGNYSISDLNGSASIVAHSRNDQVYVSSNGATSGIYEVTIFDGDVSADLTDQDFVIDEESKSGAFNIVVQLQRGLDWFEDKGSTYNDTIKVTWPGIASFFETDDRSISLLGYTDSNSDGDEFDDDVILHELGHLSMEVFSIDHSNGGAHGFTTRHDLRLAWSEGVANYISTAIREESTYVDTRRRTNGNATLALSTDFNDIPTTKGTDNESSVAHVLWKAGVEYGHDRVVETVVSFTGLSEQISMDTFRDQWESLQGSTDLSTHYDNTSMGYAADTTAGDDLTDATAITVGTQQDLSFFPDEDGDTFSFTATAAGVYTVETENTLNGALSQLEVFSTDGGGNTTLIYFDDLTDDSTSETDASVGMSVDAGEELLIRASRFSSASRNYGLGSSDGYTQTVGQYGTYDLSLSAGGTESNRLDGSTGGGGGGGGGGCLFH